MAVPADTTQAAMVHWVHNWVTWRSLGLYVAGLLTGTVLNHFLHRRNVLWEADLPKNQAKQTLRARQQERRRIMGTWRADLKRVGYFQVVRDDEWLNHMSSKPDDYDVSKFKDWSGFNALVEEQHTRMSTLVDAGKRLREERSTLDRRTKENYLEQLFTELDKLETLTKSILKNLKKQ